jgi:hypothetical protein
LKKDEPEESQFSATEKVREYMSTTDFPLQKVKIAGMKENNRAKLFASVFDTESSEKLYCHFFKRKGQEFKTSIYHILEHDKLKEHVLLEIQ